MRSFCVLLISGLLSLLPSTSVLADDFDLAANDAFLLLAETSITFAESELLANDIFSTHAIFGLVEDPRRGTLDTQWVEGKRIFTYTPNPHFYGRDHLTYRIGGSQAHVLLNVSPPRVPILGRWPTRDCHPVDDGEAPCQTLSTFGHGMEIGWYDSASAFFHLCDWQDGVAIECVDLDIPNGEPTDPVGWTPLVLDIDGDNWDELAIHNPISGVMRLFAVIPEATTQAAPGQLLEIGEINHGEPGDLPLAGHWVPTESRSQLGLYSFGGDPAATLGELIVDIDSGQLLHVATPELERPWALAGDWLDRGNDQVGLYDLDNGRFWYADAKNRDDYEVFLGILGVPDLLAVAGRTSNEATSSFLGLFDPNPEPQPSILYIFEPHTFQQPPRPIPREVVVDPTTKQD